MAKHRVEPARLLWGLTLLALGVFYAVESVGGRRTPALVLPVAVLAALAASAFVGAVTSLVRRRLDRRRRLAEDASAPTEPPAE